MTREEKTLTYCDGCNCMTKTTRKARALWLCNKCGHDKTIGDLYQSELKEEH